MLIYLLLIFTMTFDISYTKTAIDLTHMTLSYKLKTWFRKIRVIFFYFYCIIQLRLFKFFHCICKHHVKVETSALFYFQILFWCTQLGSTACNAWGRKTCFNYYSSWSNKRLMFCSWYVPIFPKLTFLENSFSKG